MSDKEHALLSASGAVRWLNCPPSARLEESLPEEESDFAKEGTLAHQLCELKLRHKLNCQKQKKVFSAEHKAIKDDPLYDAEMEGYTDAYVDYITEVSLSFASQPYTAIEKKLDYSIYAPEGFGTGDCILIGGDTIHVVDFKYGKGVEVSAEDNPQMRLYALGALSEYARIYAINKIKTHIFQPRIHNISTEELDRETLLAWGESIKPQANDAFDGSGEFKAGEHCKFCRAKALCRARGDHYAAIEEFACIKPALLSAGEVGELLLKTESLKNWVTDLEDYALKYALDGGELPGWKVVEGRSNRQFADVDAAFKVLIDAGYAEALLYTKKPITLTETEKLVGGKKTFNTLLDRHVVKPQGKPTLAPLSDKREPFKPVGPEEDFKNIK